jgi:putative SOS response-associated peptidase YedK
MCGRFTLAKEEDVMLDYYGIPSTNFTFTPRYNAAPGQLIVAIISHNHCNRIGFLQWGFIPSWSKTIPKGPPLINAKSETILEKPSFRDAFLHKRCIIPADGFYEWKSVGNNKQPMRIHLRNQSIFSMAGIYSTWVAPDGRKQSTCAILTTTPNSIVSSIHNRMPVLLRREDEAFWLDAHSQDRDRLLSLLVPFPSEDMMAYPVSSSVGKVANDSPACLLPQEEDLALF